MVSDDLRRQADNFIELDELKPMIAREGGARSTGAREHENHHPTYAQSA
jgi:uncharacterized LabA/DUF88 family protein